MSATTIKPIPKHFSVYLDLLRFGAAMMVLLFHIKNLQMGPESLLKLIPSRGHDFVILFFVLSGYVISATVDRKRNQSLRDYSLDRMARIYSVAIPALILSTVLIIADQASFIEFIKIVCSFFFLSEAGLMQMTPYLNEPYWSLCYEVMYYIGFGCFMFLEGKKRIFFLILFILVAGPKVLLLLPCWLLGVFIYHKRDSIVLKPAQALIIALVIPIALSFVLHILNFDKNTTEFLKPLLGDYYERLSFSNGFLIDYARAIIIAIHLYAMRFVVIHWSKLLETLITKAASMSFTLYLMHIPFVFLMYNNIAPENRGLLVFLICAIGIPILCYLISLFTEARRPQLRTLLDAWLPTFNK